MATSSSHEILPLLYEGDAYSLELELLSPKTLRLHRILRYPYNENVTPDEVSFFSLDSSTRAAVLSQIQRRYRGATVKI